MSWDKEYDSNRFLWGEGPSELGVAIVAYLQEHGPRAQTPEILDIGCGYGRDALHLARSIPCRILGIDLSAKAIEIARSTATENNYKNAEFQCRDFGEIEDRRFDIVFMSNLYQLMNTTERRRLRNTARQVLKPYGPLFLSTLSVSDPEHYGKGTPVPGEPNTFDDGKRIHFCTREELIEDFDFLSGRELYEREYDEPRATGETHHHISWILIGERGS